jgi:uncharacterized protein YkwD
MTAPRRRPLVAASLLVLLFLLLLPVVPGRSSVAWAGCKHRYAKPYKRSTSTAARAVVCLVNRRRVHHGIPRVSRNSDLGSAARRHSDYMQDHHCFSHTCSGEPSLMQRVGGTGYWNGAAGYACGEAIAWNRGRRATPRNIVAMWMTEPAHRSVILDRSFEHIGVGVVWGSPMKAGADAGIYTADLAYRNG